MFRLFLYTTLIISGLFISASFTTAQVSLPLRAAIGLRVFKNDDGLSAAQWYQDQCAAKKFAKCGNATPIVVDGYDGIRDGNTVYVGSANKDAAGNVFTNIYLISLAESVGPNGGEIFTQLLKNWKFNVNTNPVMSQSERDALRRDVRRRAHLMSIRRALTAYGVSHSTCSTTNTQACRIGIAGQCPTGETCVPRYPDLASGSYIRSVSFSTWPSWQATLGQALVGTLPEDRGGAAPDLVNPAKTTIQNFAGCASPYDIKTCWDTRASKMGCPALAFAYAYRASPDGGSYTLTAGYESSVLPVSPSWQEPTVTEEKHTSTTFQSAGLCLSAACGNNIIEGNEQCDGVPLTPNAVSCSACTLTCKAGFHGAPDANGTIRTCVLNVENRVLGNRNERRTWDASANQWAVAGWVLQSCNSGYVKQGNECVEAGALIWKQEAVAPWGARRGHTSVVFNNKMWVLGGYGASGYLNDVWSSSDGVTWTQQVTAGTSWSARAGHTALVFNDGSGEKIWVLGGINNSTLLNDVWSSSDGITWTQAPAAPWSARAWHAAVVFGGKMWVLGGDYKNDVWSSADGKNWDREPMASWSGRNGHTAVVFGGKMWVLGGYAAGSLNDIWSSSDGKAWVLESIAPWSARRGHASVVFNNKIWVLWGESSSSPVWSSVDGKIWTSDQGSSSTSAWRAWFPSVVFGGKMWVLGGAGGNSGILNDVWHSPP